MIQTGKMDDESWEEFHSHYTRFCNFQTFSNWDGNTYDIVFYGVSGYTGYLMMEYLKRISIIRNPEEFTFCFAGRTVSKVMEQRDRNFAGTLFEDTPVLQMSYDNLFSVVDLVR